ncbi:class I SAM-dependent methyltransferase [Blastococcus mobilis]|uniref:O-antigen chain-terminating methyltransferase n=1 Tax=Blastococcus mobilis TaxID=1938746 RepID=A0A238YLQ3_9ACTN|nr:class I SAM-dependent methyltransferase [Blastococcus mobilis]SNR72085.1 O-antigen chain-terminating methyltransferase [Blastococcus mobilis]
MSPSAARDGTPPRAREVDLERQVTNLGHAVDELRRLVGDTQERLQSVEAELRSLQASGGSSSAADGWGPRFAAIYADFTEHFRGSTAEVGAKLEGYLPDVHRLAGPGGVVDLGCGRGEWLTLLRATGVAARGVDANPDFVAAGRARGLDMELGDALGYLQALPPDSVDMVTAFHVIEHLATEDLLALLAAARGALRPGGCLLLETPNPTNLVMAACDFYNDPTHRSPLPPALTEYLVSTQGFGDIEVRPLHPKAAPPAPPGDQDSCAQLGGHVVQALFGPQDYAVLGYKLPGGTR